eukprot:scaffold2799_cov408-Prasinococcus_capsulatus_cf.AAC.15
MFHEGRWPSKAPRGYRRLGGGQMLNGLDLGLDKPTDRPAGPSCRASSAERPEGAPRRGSPTGGGHRGT